MFIDRDTTNIPAPFEGAEWHQMSTYQVELRPFERRRD